MRYGYLKELINLKGQLKNRELKFKNFKYIDVQYFEPSHALDDKMCFILNQKLDEVRQKSNLILQRLQETNLKQSDKIQMFEDLSHRGNVGIKFEEMSAE